MFSYCLFLLLAFASLSLSEVQNSNPCEEGWHFFNETGCCYKTSTEMGTWFDGTGICSKMHSGSHLASLRDEKESKFVAKSHRNGADGIHAWTGLSQTKSANNWTFTDGSKPWSSFFTPYIFASNHTSCVEIIDNWLVELFNNTGKTQPTFCYHFRKALCKYCPVLPQPSKSPVAKIENAVPRIGRTIVTSDCSSQGNQPNIPSNLPKTTFGPITTTTIKPK